jgi:hypothetical protein
LAYIPVIIGGNPMKKALAIVVAVLLLAAMAPVALAAGTTVNVSVSVDGKLLVAAEPDPVDTATVDAVIRAAHAAFYSGGESGYTAGIDSTWNMFLITQCWGVATTPYVILNDAPLASTADTTPVANGDNLIICLTSDMNTTPSPIYLKASVSGNSATVTANLWTLDFSTFAYSSSPFGGAKGIDPATGSSRGTTDANGSVTVAVPASGIIAIDGLAAIKVQAASGGGQTAPAASETTGQEVTSATAGGGTASESSASAAEAAPAAGESAAAPAASVSADSVFFSISVDGVLQVAAQPMPLPADATVNGVLAAAHEKFFSGGASGYAAGIDSTWNMFLITKCWGVTATPYVMVNGVVLGSTTYNQSADKAPIKAGDNVIVSLSSDSAKPAQAISLTADVADGSATVTATSWVLNLSTFTYTSSPLAGANVIDPVSGKSLGTTDANGQIVVPATGVAAIEGLAAIPVDGSTCATSATSATSASAAPAAAPAGGSAPEASAPTGEPTTVYVTISIDGVLQIAAQPVTTTTLTVDGALKAAHEKYYSGGAAGYHGGNASFGYVIDTIWGIQTTPYVIIGGAPLGSQKGEYSAYVSVDQCPIKEGENIVCVFSATGATLPVVSMSLDEDGYIIATSWSLDFTTFTYTEATYVDAEVIDAETGEVLGKPTLSAKSSLKRYPTAASSLLRVFQPSQSARLSPSQPMTANMFPPHTTTASSAARTEGTCLL